MNDKKKSRIPLILIVLAVIAIVVAVLVKKGCPPIPVPAGAPEKLEPPIKVEPTKAPEQKTEVKPVVLDPKVEVPAVGELRKLD